MCPDKSLFTNYKTIKGKALISNGMTCKVMKVGNIRLRMQGKKYRDLHNVRHVPKLRRNLISLRKFNEKGYLIIAKKEKLRIVKKSIRIKSEKHNRGDSMCLKEWSRMAQREVLG